MFNLRSQEPTTASVIDDVYCDLADNKLYTIATNTRLNLGRKLEWFIDDSLDGVLRPLLELDILPVV